MANMHRICNYMSIRYSIHIGYKLIGCQNNARNFMHILYYCYMYICAY